MEMARRTRTSLYGGLSWARARPNTRLHGLVLLDHRRGSRLLDDGRVAHARDEVDVALSGTERGEAGGRIGRGEDVVLVDVRTALVEVVGVAAEDHAYFPRVLLDDVGPGPDHPLLEVAVLLEDLAREDDGHRLRQVLREHRVGRLEMDAHRVLVGRLHALDFLEGEGLHAFLRVLLVAVLDVRGHELAAVEGATFCHFTPLRSLKVHTRKSGLPCHDSARSPLRVRSVELLASSEKG